MTQGLPPGDELGAGARALLDAARAGLSPDAAAVRRVHARIHLATAGGAAVGTALGVKLGVIAVVAVVAAGAAIYATRGASPPVHAPIAAVAAAPTLTPTPTPIAPTAPAASPASPASGDDEQITIEAPPPPVARSVPAAAPHRAPAAASNPAAGAAAAPRGAPAAAPRTEIALGREVELIDLAMAALRRDDPPGALRVIRAYTAEAAGAGQLGQDAAAIEIEALCKLGDPAASDKLAAFDVLFPRSAQRARLAAACR